MGHFAKVVDGKVTQVIVAEPDFFDTFVKVSSFKEKLIWFQESRPLKLLFFSDSFLTSVNFFTKSFNETINIK